MNRKRISFTIPAPEPKPEATISPKWLDPAYWARIRRQIAYIDAIIKAQRGK